MVSGDIFYPWLHLLVASLGPCNRILVREHIYLVLIQGDYNFVLMNTNG